MRLNPFGRRTDKDKPSRMDGRDLWWVRIVLNVGRPLVAVAVLVMCAPGEHYLATLAHWNEKLAWGMPTVLTAYAGIAAVVATKRPKGAEGKRTAVAGAIVSVGLAMAAQPIAHLYGYQGLTTSDIVLITVVSCIPAAVFGHLLHMAAVPGERVRPAVAVKPPADEGSEGRTDRTSVRDLSALQVEVQGTLSETDTRDIQRLFVSGRTPGTVVDTDNRTDTQVPVQNPLEPGQVRTLFGDSLPDNPLAGEPEFTTWHSSVDAMSWAADTEPDGRINRTDPDAFGYEPDGRDVDPEPEPDRLLDAIESDGNARREAALSGAPTLVRNRVAETLLSRAQADGEDVRPHVTARPVPDGEIRPIDVVRRLRSVYPAMSEADIKKRVRDELPDAKQDSIRKAVSRTRDEA
jgi:hypothetical protein